jgi:biotin carboxyl carrier protein
LPEAAHGTAKMPTSAPDKSQELVNGQKTAPQAPRARAAGDAAPSALAPPPPVVEGVNLEPAKASAQAPERKGGKNARAPAEPDPPAKPQTGGAHPLPSIPERRAGDFAAPEATDAGEKGGSVPETVARQNIVPAEIKAVNLMVLSAPRDAVIAEVTVRDGDSVDKGRLLVSFDGREDEESRTVTETLAADALNRLDAQPRGASRERDELAAEYLRLSAQVRVHENRLKQRTVDAPFAGTVTEVRIRAGEHVAKGSPLLEIAESGNLEIVCRVPSAWTRWLKPGHIVWVYVDETARSYEAVLVRLGGKVDASSRTLRAYARFSAPPADLLPGMSGSASIRPQIAEERGKNDDMQRQGRPVSQNGAAPRQDK